MVTHGNLLHNERMIRAAFGQTEESVIVGWLPLYASALFKPHGRVVTCAETAQEF